MSYAKTAWLLYGDQILRQLLRLKNQNLMVRNNNVLSDCHAFYRGSLHEYTKEVILTRLEWHSHQNLPVMGRGGALNESKRSVILARHEDGKSIRLIAGLVQRSRTAVRRLIVSGQVRALLRLLEPKPKTSALCRCLMIRHARSGQYTARSLRDIYAKQLTVRLIQQLL